MKVLMARVGEKVRALGEVERAGGDDSVRNEEASEVEKLVEVLKGKETVSL